MNEIKSFIPKDTEKLPPERARLHVIFGAFLAPLAVKLLTACTASPDTSDQGETEEPKGSYYYGVIYKNSQTGAVRVVFGKASLANWDCPDSNREGEERVSGTCTISSGPVDRKQYRESHKDILNPQE